MLMILKASNTLKLPDQVLLNDILPQRLCEASNDEFYTLRGRYIQENAILTKKPFLQYLAAISDTVCLEMPICQKCCIRKYCNHFINQQQLQKSDCAPTYVDLFCGAGGLSLGFKQEEYALSLANDIEACCIDTYTHNHPETPRQYIVKGDIRDILEDIPSVLRYKQVEVVVGGPPCQGFSMANRQRIIDDPRNHLYKSYVKTVDIIQPQFFVMENVKGMFSVANQIKEDFVSIGYMVEARILNAKDFGVPQNRERIIFIGNRLGIENSVLFEELQQYSRKQPQYVLKDALHGMKPLHASRDRNQADSYSEKSGGKITPVGYSDDNDYIKLINNGTNATCVYNHKARYNNDRDIEIFGRLDQGDKSNDPKIADIMPYANRNHIFTDKYFKLESEKVCKTITAHMKFDCNMYIHPTQARGLTPREAARVQSYPDDYFFRGAFTKTYMQIGNSVPPLLGRAIAHIIKKHLI